MIETRETLSMHYGAVKALDGIRFEIDKGEVVGLLGPNGAGKSTTLKIITSYLYPTRGTVYVGGMDVRDRYLVTRKMIGYLPERLPLYTDMEVRDYLIFAGQARGLSRSRLKSRLEWVKRKCGLVPVYRKVIRELSKGYRQRTALAQALIHDPKIVILDEPTSGLDPHQIIEIRNLLRELEQQGKTIIFSSHILQEVEAVAKRLIIINRGVIIADDVMSELQKHSFGEMCFELVLPGEIDGKQVESDIRALKEVSDCKTLRSGGEVSYIAKAKSDLRSKLRDLAAEKQWRLLELKTKPASLEQVFLTLTKAKKGAGK